jgi:16S rRNA (cytosine967-C5)-methyltransferase
MHLADLMDNRGLLWASDKAEWRLATLRKRAARLGRFNIRTASWAGGAQLPTRTKFDGVLVDAPCSGLGTWHRDPWARWTTQPSDVEELAALQTLLLGHAAAAVKPGGRLVYAVCTVTTTETTAITDAFEAAHPEFRRAPLGLPVVDGVCRGPEVQRLQVWQGAIGANGMFIAAWVRQ